MIQGDDGILETQKEFVQRIWEQEVMDWPFARLIDEHIRRITITAQPAGDTKEK